MTDAMSYALSRSTDDVAEPIRWLEAEGFVCVRERGGAGASFGDVSIEFERSGIRVGIGRDRGQWMLAIASPGGRLLGLDIWLTAMRGTRPEPGPRRSFERLPEQVPEGESWRAVVPGLIDWIRAADRSAELAAVTNNWSGAARDSSGFAQG